jgi:ferredoxin
MHPQRQALYETCQRLKVGITVMKAFGGGDLLSEFSRRQALTPLSMHSLRFDPPCRGVRWYQGHGPWRSWAPYCLCGCAWRGERTMPLLLPNCQKSVGKAIVCTVATVRPVRRELMWLLWQSFWIGRRTGRDTWNCAEHYAALPHKAGQCVRCGACDKRCPFEVAAMTIWESCTAVWTLILSYNGIWR